MNRPRGGMISLALMAFGEIHCSGGSVTTAILVAGWGTRPDRNEPICLAAWRPDSAATSAVSAAWIRFPAAKTPGTDVARPVSTAGPRVPESSGRPADRASSWSGIQSPVNTSQSHATVRDRPPSPSATSTEASRPPAPVTRVTADDVQTGTPQRSAAPSRKAA